MLAASRPAIIRCSSADRRSPLIERKRRLSKADSAAVPVARATAAGHRDRFVPDAADGARAAAALDAAAETAIDLAGGARRLAATERRAHVLVAQHVARTDDHGRLAFPSGLVQSIIIRPLL